MFMWSSLAKQVKPSHPDIGLRKNNALRNKMQYYLKGNG